MAVNAALTASFKQAALDIFNSMITGDGEYYADKTDYDPVTGTPTAGGNHLVRMARVNFSVDEISALGLDTEDTKFIFLQDEIPVSPVATSGKITYDSTVYQLLQVQKDPADVLWIVAARRV